MAIEILSAEHRAGLRRFQEIYGDDWQHMVGEFNQGRYCARASHISHIIRQIRNQVTGNPSELPDLRE